MLDKFKEQIKKEAAEILKTATPKHIAITMDGIPEWAKKNNKDLEEAYKESFIILKSTIKSQVRTNTPVLTFYLLPDNIKKDSEEFSSLINKIEKFFDEIINSEIITKNKIKISVLGKWYNLPSKAVEAIKKTLDATKDYDNFFLNFCINYDGQEEIIDACKLLAMKVMVGKLDPETINKESIKDNIYSSYFLPPDLTIINGKKKQISDLLLWDSPNSNVYFTDEFWPDFSKIEFSNAIEEFKKGK